MDPKTVECHASIWPHHHTNDMGGPLDIKISFRNQPPIVRGWNKTDTAIVCLEQPDERTNLTLLKLVLRKPYRSTHESFNGRWYDINQCRVRRDGGLKFYLKVRLVNSVPHPIPRGRWSGGYTYTDRWCIFIFQAMTMKVKPTDEPRIILPDGTLPAEKKIKLVLP